MILRPANPADLSAIMLVETKSFIKPVQESKQVFQKRLELCPQLFLIFENDEKQTAGYLCAEVMNKIPDKKEDLQLGHIPSPCEKINQSYIYISSFALLPEFRGNGNGSRLWNQSLAYLARFQPKGFLLLVNECWKGAYHIYEKSGFVELGKFSNFFPSDEQEFSNGILMGNLIE